MEFLRFNETELIQMLGRLPVPFRTAFAAAAAERLMPAYGSFSRRTGRGDPEKFAAILERLWLDLEGSGTSAKQEHDDIELSMSLIPEEDSGRWIPEQAYAEDAAAALAYALTSRKSGRAQDAAFAARRVYEALDHFVLAQERINTNEDAAETRVLSHPLIQAELSRQQRDLRELAADQQILADQQALGRTVNRIRQRAKNESETVFKLVDYGH